MIELSIEEIEEIKPTYGCIYVFRNKINGKYYVGQTIHPERRYKGHINAAKKGIDTLFYRALRKYGIENFDYKIIWGQLMPYKYAKENLNYFEKYYIKLFDSYKNGYNMTIGGDGTVGKPNKMKGKKYPEETRKRMGLPKGHVATNKGTKYPPEIREHMGAPKGIHRVYHEDGSYHMEK